MPAMLYGCLDALINATRPFLRSAEQRKWRAAEPQGCLGRRSAYLLTLVSLSAMRHAVLLTCTCG